MHAQLGVVLAAESAAVLHAALYQLRQLRVLCSVIHPRVYCQAQAGITLFLALIYWVNLYVFAFSFASERYSAMLMPFRYMLCAVGLYAAVELIRERRARKRAAA